jgi:hypothetical protein
MRGKAVALGRSGTSAFGAALLPAGSVVRLASNASAGNVCAAAKLLQHARNSNNDKNRRIINSAD